MEKILIDGYNLLYKDDALKNLAERSLEAAREQLVAGIAAYRTGDMEIIVVFDGRGASTARNSSRPGVQVRFSAFPKTADQLIVELMDREPRRSSLTVVTSDRKDIGRVVRAEGVRWISSESFLGRLRRARKSASSPAIDKPRQVSEDDVEYWLKRFASDPEQGEQTRSDEQRFPRRRGPGRVRSGSSNPDGTA